MMNFSKASVIVLLLLLAIVGGEFYYFQQQRGESEKNTLVVKSVLPDLQEKNTTEAKSPPSEIDNAVREKEKEDKKILQTVSAYQKGYQEGCQKASKTNTATTAQTEHHRAYLLGFEKGQTECLSQIKQKKEHYDLGYKDGCNSAISQLVKDTALYQSSAEYQKGWERGAKKCASKSEKVMTKKPKEKAIKVNKNSPDYQNGYRHGCSSAKGSYTRQEDIYLRSRAYREGWTLGRQKCKSTTKSISPAHKRHYFEQGYRDGCDSARGYYRRDSYKYRYRGSYAEGWRAGEYECSGF